MMNQKFIKSVVLGGLVASSLVLGSYKANATGFHQGINHNGMSVTSAKFYEVLAKTKFDQLVYNFGRPDDIQSLKDTSGAKVGTVWVYRDAVKVENNMRDARIVVIDGKLQYATLADPT